MKAALHGSPKETFRSLPIPTQRSRKYHTYQRHKASKVSYPSPELSPSQAGQELAARVLKGINEDLSRRRFQNSLRDGNLALAEQQINEVLSVYQQSQWHRDLQLSALPLQQTKSKPLHALHEHVQGFFTLCLQRKKLASALNCARSLPPSPSLFTALLKACLDHGDFHAVAQAVEVSKYRVPALSQY